MNKKKFYIITTCCLIAAIIAFQIVMYYIVGEETLLKNGKIRSLWLSFPIVFLCLSFLRDFIIKKNITVLIMKIKRNRFNEHNNNS